jgi:hypothetical protein
MALSLKSLARQGVQAVVGVAGGTASARQVSLFLYATDDAAATVETAGYWNGARALLQNGDQVAATMAAAGTPILKHYVFTSVPATGNVVAALQTTTAG